MLGLLTVSSFASWIVGAEVSGDPTSAFALLGPFAAAALALGFGWRDTAKRLDRAEARLEAMNDTNTPVLIEIRDVLRTVHTVMNANTTAMNATAEGLKRIPSEAEIVRLRDALAGGQTPGSHGPWST